MLGYEFTTRRSFSPAGPLSTSSSMLHRVTENPNVAGSLSQMALKNFCTLRSSFCEMRLHVE